MGMSVNGNNDCRVKGNKETNKPKIRVDNKTLMVFSVFSLLS